MGSPFFINSTDKNEQLIADSCTISSFNIGSRLTRSLRRRHRTILRAPKRALDLEPHIRGGDTSKVSTAPYKTIKTKRRCCLCRPFLQPTQSVLLWISPPCSTVTAFHQRACVPRCPTNQPIACFLRYTVNDEDKRQCHLRWSLP